MKVTPSFQVCQLIQKMFMSHSKYDGVSQPFLGRYGQKMTRKEAEGVVSAFIR